MIVAAAARVVKRARMNRSRRRRGLSLAIAIGVLGAALAVVSVELRSIWLFFVGILAFGAAILVVNAGLRPEPLELSRRLQVQDAGPTSQAGQTRGFGSLMRAPGVRVAVLVVVLAQAVMIMIMGITSLYMKDIQHSLGDVSLVFAAHTLGMFAFSPLSGRLSDRLGRGPVMLAGGLPMMLSTVIAPASTQIPALVSGLFLLGGIVMGAAVAMCAWWALGGRAPRTASAD